MLELRDLDQVVKGGNAGLERAADKRRVKEPDTVARPQDGLPVRVLQRPLYEAVVPRSWAEPVGPAPPPDHGAGAGRIV